MKNKLVFYLIIFILFSISVWYSRYNYEIGMIECVEDGVCKQGLSIIENKQEVIINKNNCILLNGKWKENLKGKRGRKINACYFR